MFLFGYSDGGLKCIMNLNNEASITNLAEVSAKDRLVWNVFEKLTSQVML